MITGIVVDKDGRNLTDEDLRNKIINIPNYYDLVLPIRKRIKKRELCDTKTRFEGRF